MTSKWIISLSNGENIAEDKNVGDPTRSPWLNLVDYIKANNLEIRHVKLIVNGIEYNSPTVNSTGKFSNYAPVKSFWVARRHSLLIATGGNRKVEDFIEYSYSDGTYRHHTIVDVNSNSSWIEVSKLDEGLSLSIKNIAGEDW